MKGKTNNYLLILFVALVIVGAVFAGIKSYSEYGMTNYLVSKYGWNSKDINIISHDKGRHTLDLDPFTGGWKYHYPVWVVEYQGREFNVEYAKFRFMDDYQLEDVFKWCTEYLQKNVDERISGVEMYSDIIYHSPSLSFEYELPWDTKKVFSKDDAFEILELIIATDGEIGVFLETDDLEKYGQLNEPINIFDKYSVTNEYYDLKENISNSLNEIFNSDVKVVLIIENNTVDFTREKGQFFLLQGYHNQIVYTIDYMQYNSFIFIGNEG